MSAPGGPRPGNAPPNYNPGSGNAPPNYNPGSLADGMQNLQLNQRTGPPMGMGNSGGPRQPPPFGQQAPPFPSSIPPSSSFRGGSPMTRPGPSLPGAFPRSSAPPGVPPQAAFPPNMALNRPSGPPSIAQPPPPFGSRPPPPAMSSPGMPPSPFTSSGHVAPPPGSRPSLSPFGSSPLTTGPVLPASSTSGPFSNGPPSFETGTLQGGPRFPLAGSPLPGQVGPAQHNSMLSRGPSPVSSAHPFHGSPPTGAPPGPMQQVTPFAPPPQGVPPTSGSSPYLAPPQGAFPSTGSPYAPQPWSMHSQQVSFQKAYISESLH